CIDWSWNLLSDSEQIVLSRLTVFAGGFTLEAAAQVCAGEGIESHQVFGFITQLVQKSLVVENRDIGNEQRYRLLETIRQYAREKLASFGQEETIRTRHLHYFLQLSELAEPALKGPAQIEWRVKLNAERDNIRVALTWADKTDVEAGLYLCSRFGRFWESFDIREENDWLSTFLQKPGSQAYQRARAMALYTHLGILNYLNQRDTWRSTADECLELCRALGNQSIEMDILLMRAGNISNAAQRADFFQTAIKLAQASGDIWRQARTLDQVGWHYVGDERLSYWKQAIKLFRQAGDWRSLAQLLCIAGYFALLNSDLELAQKSLAEAAVLNDQLKDKLIKAEILSAYAQLATISGEYDQAHVYFQAELETWEELGSRLTLLWCRSHLGDLALKEGNFKEARDILTETARAFFNDKTTIGVVFTLEKIANLCVAIGNPETAAQLIGWADATRRKLDDIRPRLEQEDVDKCITACIESMGEIAFSDAYDEGQKMTLEEALVYALKES
ncbi:MAG TPA: tetratricopeptide repeat protein, partial [Anaerolineales bacterium]|nr:tetratricopeptide repeat protein [Anaerolineales bacterium]